MKKYINKKLNWTAEMVLPNIYHVKINDTTQYVLPSELIESSPDWELQQSWQILGFNDGGDIHYFNKGDHSFPYKTIGGSRMLSYDYAISSGKEIHSVSREDGVILTIGDKTDKGEIEKFEISEFGEMIAFIHAWHGDIKFVTPSPAVLFTTEDGVDMKEGDKVFVVNEFEIIEGCVGKTYKHCDWLKCFSTREAAEDFIKWNQPRYSLNDIKEYYEQKELYVAGGLAEDFFNFINNKK